MDFVIWKISEKELNFHGVPDLQMQYIAVRHLPHIMLL